MAVGVGVGLAVGAGFRPTAVAAQAAAGAVTATARVLPALGVLPRRVEAFPGVGQAGPDSWRWVVESEPRPPLPSLPGTTVTRQVVGNRRVLELAVTGA